MITTALPETLTELLALSDEKLWEERFGDVLTGPRAEDEDDDDEDEEQQDGHQLLGVREHFLHGTRIAQSSTSGKGSFAV